MFYRYPVSLFKRLCQAYDLSKKDAIIWGVCIERIAIDKYRSFGDAVVEPTGKMKKKESSISFILGSAYYFLLYILGIKLI